MRKVLWSEGILVLPHHFQQFDDYHEGLVNSRVGAHVPYAWGLLKLRLNEKERLQGRFKLEHCRVVMDDGLIVDIPDHDFTPEAIPIGKYFDSPAKEVDVYLAIPEVNEAANFQVNGESAKESLRYRLEIAEVPDQTTGKNRQRLSFARKNIQLLFDGESRSGYRTIRIARTRKAGEAFELVEECVPPLLNIKAAPWIGKELSALVKKLLEKQKHLSEQGRQGGGGRAFFHTSDLTSFWMLHTVNSAYPVLDLLRRLYLVHPLSLFVELLRLAGALSTFAGSSQLADLAEYDHDNLHETFRRLFKRLHFMLDLVHPTDYVRVSLEPSGEGRYVGAIRCNWPLDQAGFFLGISADEKIIKLNVIGQVPDLIKVASGNDIESRIRRNLDGLPLVRTSKTGLTFPVGQEFEYFSVDRTAPGNNDPSMISQEEVDILWANIRESKTIAIFVPKGPLRGAQLEMYVCKP